MDGRPEEHPELEIWRYDSPPTAFDFVSNGFLSNGLRLGLHAALRLYLRLYHRFEAQNAAQLRDASSCLIVANHSSHLDVIALLSAFPLARVNHVRSLAARDYFFRNPLVRTLAFLLANIVPLERGRMGSDLLACCRQAVTSGANLIVFPEGTRSADGSLGEFKAGVGLLARMLGVPVIPAAVDGARASLAKGRLLPRPRKLRVAFGEKADYSQFETGKAGWREIARDLRARVAALQERMRARRD